MAGPGFELRCILHSFYRAVLPFREDQQLEDPRCCGTAGELLASSFLGRSIASITELFESPRSQKEDSQPRDLSDI
jgi:hypothetical protein